MEHSSDTSEKETQNSEKSLNLNEEVKGFVEKLDDFQTPEEKITFGLAFMRETISQEGSPRFREFWDSRRLVLPLFKENIHSIARTKFWEEYIELTQEARRLKDVLEEQSAFAVEQIDLAIGAIENELKQYEEYLVNSEQVQFNPIPFSLRSKISFYATEQKELNLLNAFASRLNALRKEVVKTEMRIRFKTKFFKRLSSIGDQIFPKRKEKIDQVSESFNQDVSHFVSKHFKGDEVIGAPYYALREEIKAFQSLAKAITLSSSSFSSSRLLLSSCWDKIKVLDKEHKKVLQEKKEASSEALELIRQKLKDLKERSSDMILKDLDQEIDALTVEMKAIYIDKEDLRTLKDTFSEIRKPHLEAQDQKRKELEEAERERLRNKKEKIASIQEEISSLSREGESMGLEKLEESFKTVFEEFSAIDLSKGERKQIERFFVPIKDLIADKKEASMISLSDDQLKTLENYRIVLNQKKERRSKIKEQVDSYRKALGASSLDFEKSFQLSELLEVEKERLEKASESIDELEEKIAELDS